MSIPKIIDYGERIFLVLLIAPFFVSFARYLPTHPFSFGLVISEGIAVALILIRRPGEIATAPYPLAIALIGTALPLLARPGVLQLVPWLVSAVMMFGGLLINISAKLALNRSYGLIAANRGVKRGGPYQFVRHPMYLGYFITQLGFLLAAFSPHLLALYLACWTCQILRMFEEEKVLMRDIDYQNFAREVPRKILPGF